MKKNRQRKKGKVNGTKFHVAIAYILHIFQHTLQTPTHTAHNFRAMAYNQNKLDALQLLCSIT